MGISIRISMSNGAAGAARDKRARALEGAASCHTVGDESAFGASQTSTKQLTPMEKACLRLVAQHLSSKEIAGRLGIAKTSVDTYCNRARRKLGVADRYHAARCLVPDTEPGGAHVPPGSASARAAISPTQRPIASFRRWPEPTMAAIAILALVFAIATLLAGLRALEVMKPAPSAFGTVLQ